MASVSRTNIEHLRSRWANTQIGNPSSMAGICPLQSPFGHVQETGLQDFRGLRSFSRFVIAFERWEVEHADFSYAQMKAGRFDYCSLIDCVFYKADLTAAYIRGSDFNNTTFDSVEFRNAGIGTWGGTFNGCDFIAPRMADTIFERPYFVDCRFLNCHLRRVHFEGSSFKRVEFSGKLQGCWFRGKYSPSQEVLFKATPKNIMDHVSFENCEIRGMHTTDGCDLSTVILPKHGHYAILPRKSAIAEWAQHAAGDLQGTAEEDEIRSYAKVAATDLSSTYYLYAREDFVGSKYSPNAGPRIWAAICNLPGVRMSREAAEANGLASH